MLHTVLREAGGDAGTALRLAVEQAEHDLDVAAALRRCLDTAAWGRPVREELAGHRWRPAGSPHRPCSLAPAAGACRRADVGAGSRGDRASRPLAWKYRRLGSRDLVSGPVPPP